MESILGGVAVGWVVCELSKDMDPRTRLAVAGGAVLGALAVHSAAKRVGKYFLATPISSQRGRITYAKSQFDAPEDAPPRVIVAATGSVATVKVPEVVVSLLKELEQGTQVKVLLSSSGEKMLAISEGYNAVAWKEMQKLGVEVLTDPDEWDGYENVKKDTVVHIELRRWADCLLVAPCSAHTLGKVATGLSDNLLSSLIRAWDPLKPLVVAPAMNTVMWEHPATATHLATLTSWGFRVVPPASKLLACNDYGRGALADVTDIVQAVTVELEGFEGRRLASGVGSWQQLGFAEWSSNVVSDC